MRDFSDLSTAPGLNSNYPYLISSPNDYTPQAAEAEVKEAMKENPAIGEPEGSGFGGGVTSRRGSDATMTDDTTPPGGSQSTSTPSSNPTTPGQSSTRRRNGPPGSIPNFPGVMAPRDPPPFFNSPTTSPPAPSPFSSPPARPSGSLRLPSQPFAMPDATAGSPASPWLHLAATSGAPTPSIDGPGSGPGRNSPHLGYPFERLNIGGSWSGANLWGDRPAVPDMGRRRSDDMSVDPPSSPNQPAREAQSGPSLNPETLARYRMMAGKASATNGRGQSTDIGSSGTSTSSPMSTSPTAKPPLPPALAKRRASLPKNVLGGILSPPVVTGSKAPSPLASSTTSPSPNPGLKPLTPSSLGSLLHKASTLILDLRPPSAYQVSHLPSSHAVPVPSTLLRRPAFNLSKLVQMLSPKSSEAVSQWRDKSDIVLIDSDSTSLASNSSLEGVAGKFEREGYSGNMWFVRGGHAAAKANNVELVADEEDNTDDESGDNGGGALHVGKLGKLAFSQESTGSNLQSKQVTSPAVPPTPRGDMNGDPFASATSSHSSRTRRGPVPSLRGTIDPSALSLQDQFNSYSKGHGANYPASQAKMQPANPFFDNIRQNLELSYGGGHERISLELPRETQERANDLPTWLKELVTMSEQDSAERLAEEFYKVELGEQKRLQAVMDWHSKSSGQVVATAPAGQRELDQKARAELSSWSGGDASGENYFPYSITAGVERGTKNRYKNIWPYDFSRVRLESPPEDEGDYINASFVQPRGTSRRYIATQGPLDATYRDFWLLVWEQKVSVIVMLTKQYEGGTVKCGNYWQDQQYGPVKIKLESQSGGEDAKPSDVSGFDFGMAADSGKESTENIQRIFTISRDDKPHEAPRRIVQIQCTAWPDFDVPDSPQTLINLMRDVDQASCETCTTTRETDDRADHPPVLVHCSAGVGRTGTFIIVDAIVDTLRRERRAQFPLSRGASSSLPASPSQQPLHGASLPSLPISAPVHSMVASRESSNERDSMEEESGVSGSQSPLDSNDSAAHRYMSTPGSGSGDSSKSVSFLVPPSSGSANPSSSDSFSTVFSRSPSSFTQKEANASPVRDLPIKPLPIGSTEMGKVIPELEAKAAEMEHMDVDQDVAPEPSEEDKRRAKYHDLFSRHRGGSSGSSAADSDADFARRPSLATMSGRGSSDRWSSEKLPTNAPYTEIGVPVPITKSNERHRPPSPVTDTNGLSPVAIVLEGMRMQRMSLVQSLRQYLYVHRAIVQMYLDMVDEDRRLGKEAPIGDRPVLQSSSSHGTSFSTDEEGPNKRRASPTELVPENTAAGARASIAASLAKRPSFKKMRSTAVDVITPEEDTPPGSTSSPAVPRPRRSSHQTKE